MPKTCCAATTTATRCCSGARTSCSGAGAGASCAPRCPCCSRRCAAPASSPATAWPASCPICRKPSPRCWPPTAWAWTSCSPDFGVDGAVERFGQTEPKLLFCPDGYWYAGKAVDIRAKMAALARRCLGAANHRGAVSGRNRRVRGKRAQGHHPGGLHRRVSSASAELRTAPFRHPLFILYSSGTTGKPKCIVHGGALCCSI